jgi:diguanylate cyclase (GGDEF)-like protein
MTLKNGSRPQRIQDITAELPANLAPRLDALIDSRLRDIRLPPDIMALYGLRMFRINRHMMAAYCYGVAAANFMLSILDIWLVTQHALVFVLGVRALTDIMFLGSGLLLAKQRWRGSAHLLIMVPCLTTLTLSMIAGRQTGLAPEFLIFLFQAITVIYVAIIFVPMNFTHTWLLAVIAAFIIIMLATPEPALSSPEKWETISSTLFIGTTLVYGRWVQNLHLQRAFLLQTRVELQVDRERNRSAALTNMAYTDRLTDIPNRRYFDEIVETLHAQPDAALPLSLCVVDIDHFKTLNDTLGHLQGDRCLRLVATSLRHCLRTKNDVLARYGGEEFVVLLPKTTLEQAQAVAEDVRRAVMKLEHPNPGTSAGIVTVSVGVACAASPPLSIEALLHDADEALYRAKAAGRNKVEA